MTAWIRKDARGGGLEAVQAWLARPGLALPGFLGMAHFVVDASSNLVLTRLLPWMAPAAYVVWFVAYNLLAFAIQPFVGTLTDRFGSPRAVAAAGLVTTGAAFFVPLDLVWLPVALAGLGNALFHVGAGALALGATRFRASGPGLFVAPGALGVGVMMGPAIPRGAEWTLMSILALFLLAMPLLPDGESKRAELAAGAFRPAGAWWVLILLLAAIGLRSLVGLRIGDRAGSFAGGALALAAAAVAGKALGGIVADRLGWIRTVVPALIVSAAMLACEGLWPAIAAVLLFQAVTGVTLAALFRVLPDRPASAFGLGSLALFAGALPVLLNVDLSPLGRSHLDALFGIVAALCVLGALALLRRNEGLSRTLP